MQISETESLLVLTHIPLLGPQKIRKLITHIGSAQGVLNATATELRQIPNMGPKTVDAILNWQALSFWQEDLHLVKKEDVQLLSFQDPLFPPSLKVIPAAPVLLYVKGTLLEQDFLRSVAVIGTRRATRYGLEMSFQLSRQLSAQGSTIISGLALGIDTAAHKAALEVGRTIAIIGSGLLNIYPRENYHLAQEIFEKGAVISEFPMLCKPDKQNFPLRNRIVSGMAEACILCEAPLRSGAMITMQQAKKFNKACFALPGRADHPNFQGNHSLIKKGEARLIDSYKDVFSVFNEQPDLFQDLPVQVPKVKTSPEEQQLLEKMPIEEFNIEELACQSQIPIHKLNILLMSLVLKKAIKEYPGKLYKKICY